jgi:hypothetical protein
MDACHDAVQQHPELGLGCLCMLPVAWNDNNTVLGNALLVP